jgi:hypothetical protein
MVVPTEPCQVNTLRYKKNTYKLNILYARPFCHTALIHTTYPKILTGAPNGEGREDKTYKLNKKNQIHRAVNLTLTYALSHGGYRLKYRVAWHGGVIIMHSLGPD